MSCLTRCATGRIRLAYSVIAVKVRELILIASSQSQDAQDQVTRAVTKVTTSRHNAFLLPPRGITMDSGLVPHV